VSLCFHSPHVWAMSSSLSRPWDHFEAVASCTHTLTRTMGLLRGRGSRELSSAMLFVVLHRAAQWCMQAARGARASLAPFISPLELECTAVVRVRVRVRVRCQ
jgi:hypothetical protein